MKTTLPLLRLLMCFGASIQAAQTAESQKPTNEVTKASVSKPLAAVLSTAKWQEVESAVDRALTWIATHQAKDGSFETYPSGQPAVTSLAAMDYLSRGHQPGQGTYGEQINRAIDFVVSCQKSNGLICFQPPGPFHEEKQPSHTAAYNHAISALMLGEVYGQVSGQRAKDVKQAIRRALQFSRQLQTRPKSPDDSGGWRYIPTVPSGIDSDLSVTGWQLMFLRSARNAEFDVPQAWVDAAVAYARRVWDPTRGTFHYQMFAGKGVRATRGMAGAGILCLSMGGQHRTPMALAAGDWLLAHPFTRFGETESAADGRDRFFYSTYYCSQAMVQLGGKYWEQFFPNLVDVLIRAQSNDGSWPSETGWGDGVFGNVYSSSLAVLSLTPPYQLLPVYQR
jgi:hypothetical protein